MFKKINYYLPNLKQSWIICLFIIIVGGLFGSFVFLPLTFINPDISKMQFIRMLQFLIVFIPALIYIIYKGDLNYKLGENKIPLDATNIGKNNIIIILITFLLFLITSSIIVEPLTSWIPMSESTKELFREMSKPGLFNFLTIVICAPLCEEFFLRGIIARGLFYNYNAAKGIFWSALMFAIIHLNIWQGLGAFVIGAFIAWVYYRTHSLKLCISIHLINNLLVYILTLKFPNLDVDTTLKDILSQNNPFLYPIVFIISVIIIIIVIKYLNKVLPNDNTFKITEQIIIENHE